MNEGRAKNSFFFLVIQIVLAAYFCLYLNYVILFVNVNVLLR